MTQKIRGTQYSMMVTDIQHAYKTRNDKFIHLITFTDLNGDVYRAEEYEADARSRFKLNSINTFEVTQPGKPGYLDWVRVVSGAPPAQEGKAATRDDMIIAQSALKCAVDYGLKNKLDEDKIVELAYKFAGNIKVIAKHLAEDFI